jgi:hypothetical protein
MQFYLFSADRATNQKNEFDETILTRWQDGSTLVGEQGKLDWPGVLTFQDLAIIKGSFASSYFLMKELILFDGQLKMCLSVDEDFQFSYEIHWRDTFHFELRVKDFATEEASTVPTFQIIHCSECPDVDNQPKKLELNQFLDFGEVRVFAKTAPNFAFAIEKGLNIQIAPNNQQLLVELCTPINDEITKVVKFVATQTNMLKEINYFEGKDRNNALSSYVQGINGWRVSYRPGEEQGSLEAFWDELRFNHLNFCETMKKWKEKGVPGDQHFVIRGDTSMSITEAQLKESSLMEIVKEKMTEIQGQLNYVQSNDC